MYQFSTKQGDKFYTFFSPEEISKYIYFDSYDDAGNSKVIERKNVNFESFKFDKCFCGGH